MEYINLMDFLKDIASYQKDFLQKRQEEKKAASDRVLKEKQTGELMRDAEMERMSSM